MPFIARLKIAAWLGLYLAFSLGVVGLAFTVSERAWPGWMLAGLFLALAVVLLDAFYPRVSLFARSLSRIPQDAVEDTIALTFDDGPVEPYTRQILEILDRYGVKASFFCIGENVQRYPDLARDIVRRGHTLGNHTQRHRNLMLTGTAGIERELEEAQRAIEEACGLQPRFFRCPKGYKSPLVTRALRRRALALVAYGYPIWDVENPPTEQLVARVLDRAAPGDIVVMHDGFPPAGAGPRDSLVAALPRIIEGLLARGLRPVSLDQAVRPLR